MLCHFVCSAVFLHNDSNDDSCGSSMYFIPGIGSDWWFSYPMKCYYRREATEAAS